MYKKEYLRTTKEDTIGKKDAQMSGLDINRINSEIESATYEEFYPKVLVYKNLFKDLDHTLAVLKRSEEEKEQDISKRDSMLGPWHDWYIFGLELDEFQMQKAHESDQTKEELAVLNEIIENFYIATGHYFEMHNVNAGDNWFRMGPSICKYYTQTDNGPIVTAAPNAGLAMHYHSDFQIENKDEPGHKFAITCCMYLNDDYKGGEVDFMIGDNMKLYTPKAGDIMVFPAGNPELELDSDGELYYHGVKKITESTKYFIRCNWVYYSDGSKEWQENEEKYGAPLWAEMEKERKRTEREKGLYHVEPKEGVIRL